MKKKALISIVLISISLIIVCFAWDAFAFFNLKTVSIDEVKSTCIESSQQTVTDVQIKKTEEYPEYLFAICSVETYDGTKGDELFLFERAYYLDKYETERYKIKEFSQAISSSKEVGSLFCELKNADEEMEKTLLYFSSNRNSISTATFYFKDGEKVTKTVNESEAFLMFVPDSEEFAKEEVFEIEFFDSKGDLIYSEISKSGSPTGK